ncbi:rho guanine nucleotide exchange factor 19 isoform X2 [Labrus bergylta]|uniref:Si:ch73-15b2.5 n=1 Tax=Labrus bergylta TaxID=56723 RepID=A0A3Q3GDH8_9LABR|nr:rho guanine nucleotide exchange factor 19-like isoform X2 [Labrus bergylta]
MWTLKERNESSHCLKRQISADLHPRTEVSQLVGNLFSQIKTMMTGERLSLAIPSPETNSAKDSGGLNERSNSLNLMEGCSPTMDISSALRPADRAEEEMQSVTFHSKFVDFFPLYQEYCLQDVKEDLSRIAKSFVSELITQSHFHPSFKSVAASPQSSPLQAPPSSLLPQPIRVIPCTLWQELEEVKASGLLGSLTAREIRLQESMFELIGSEASYLRSLRVAVNHFYASAELKETLSKREHHVLFSNSRVVMAASEKFLMDLEMRLGERVLMSQVGDIVLQNCPEFYRLYVPYVTNMMYQEALVNQLLQQNRDFLSSVKKLENDPVCQRQSLKSFLVLPFQRITRMKLILESILKLTEPGSASILNLEKAIEAIHEIVTECDKGVQNMKQIEELVSLQMLMDFGKVKSVPLVVRGRFLVHHGPMRQLTLEAAHSSRISFISVYLHLFNDLLIISSKNVGDQRFLVLDHAEFPTQVRLEPLKAEVLGLPADSLLLHLSKSQTGHPTAMILVTNTRSDKRAWRKLLS